ncbi:hypothetical protein CACET_c22370 [Clostridium aceticum]|uniref:Uncharacterized protein n=1 Tax=Clostridium aceticum TaxID=84022 RepID=A0A0G3WBF4_9CLOT|nr:M48 family metallopeptidase [Clostridium aceticum]AKL95683.1 hypothetical protein CACET_c22370 [Clostridium aceticum]
MIEKDLFIHPLEEILLQEMIHTVVFDEDVMYHYKNYTEKMRKPDLLGKTVKVTKHQFPELYHIAERISDLLGMAAPCMYVYEDFYYGVESKGVNEPWIEISAKTVTDFTKAEMTFLLGRELCDIYLKHNYYNTMINELLEVLENSSLLPMSQQLATHWKMIMYKWSRVAYYTSDCFGYLICNSMEASINAIKKSILNNCFLAENMNLQEYIKQGEEIHLLDDDVLNFTKLDEIVPYGPFRIKNLLSYAASSRGVRALIEMHYEEGK